VRQSGMVRGLLAFALGVIGIVMPGHLLDRPP
jgi:hypothetical protein